MQIYNPYSLEGKTILVTGASSGIGKATAIESSKVGARVILTARNTQRLQETFSLLSGDGHFSINANLSSEKDILKLVNSLPVIDGFVHAAGITCDKPIKFYSPQHIEETFSINVFSGMYIIQHALKQHKLADEASLIFLSSIASFVANYGNGIYSASKAALEAFSRQCVIELKNKKIRSNTICPGIITTEMMDSYLSHDSYISNSHKQMIKEWAGRPEDIAWMAIFLLSDASRHVNGTSINVDGGYNIGREI